MHSVRYFGTCFAFELAMLNLSLAAKRAELATSSKFIGPDPVAGPSTFTETPESLIAFNGSVKAARAVLAYFVEHMSGILPFAQDAFVIAVAAASIFLARVSACFLLGLHREIGLTNLLVWFAEYLPRVPSQRYRRPHEGRRTHVSLRTPPSFLSSPSSPVPPSGSDPSLSHLVSSFAGRQTTRRLRRLSNALLPLPPPRHVHLLGTRSLPSTLSPCLAPPTYFPYTSPNDEEEAAPWAGGFESAGLAIEWD